MQNWTRQMEMFTAVVGAAGAIAGVVAPLVAARRQRARMLADALTGEEGNGAGDGVEDEQSYQPPGPMAPPRKLPPPPAPSPVVLALSGKGPAALAAVLAWTPLAPLALFAGPLLAVLGMWAAESEQAKIAQPRLRQAIEYALEGAEYEGYTEEWAAGMAAWEGGLEQKAREHFDRAEAAGKARRLEVARLIDRKERDAYRAWMAKPHALMSDRDWLWRGYHSGEGGFTMFPIDRVDTDRTSVSYIRRADLVSVRYHWRPGHPDYEGYEYPPATAEQIATAERAREVQQDAEAYEGILGEGASEIDDIKRQGGGGVRARGTRAPEPPPSPPVTPPLTKVPNPGPPITPPAPPAPKPKPWVPPGKTRPGPPAKELPDDGMGWTGGREEG